MSILEERQFFAGENSDYEDRKMEPGDYRFGLNIEVDSVDSSNMGVVTNSKGNRLVSVLLPSGTNEVIGQGGDDSNEHTYYFLYNSTSRHSIFRFNHLAGTIDLVMENPMFNFSVDHRVNSVNIVDNKLLYFNDGFNPPRKINVNKATEAGKLRKFNIYFGDKPQQGESYTITASFNGVTINSWTYTSPVVTNGSAYDLAHDISVFIAPNALVNFTACGASVEAEFANPGEYDLAATSTVADQVIVVAENFYPKPYPEDFIDRLKYPLECEPVAGYKSDPDTEINLVQERVFQFAVQYVYDDKERSAISPYSVIAVNLEPCRITTVNSNLNYIEVDFTDIRLNDPIRRSIIKQVNVMSREHNTGELKLVASLQPHQFGVNQNIYKFYNDTTSSVIPDSEANKLFDSVPIVSGTSDVIASRMFDSNILEGYDPVCVDADINVAYQEIDSGVTISGILSIIQFTNDDPLRWSRQPIYDAGSDGILWGRTKYSWLGDYVVGYSPAQEDRMVDYNITHAGAPCTGQVISAKQWMPGSYGYRAPVGGFIVYLAGTDYYAITRQRIIRNVPGGVNISIQDVDTGLVSWDTQQEWGVMHQVSIGDTGYDNSFVNDWSINGVKPGVYSLRIASSDIGFNDLIDPDRSYQRTSTTIQKDSFAWYNGGVCNTGKTEAIIEVLVNGTIIVRDPDTYLPVYTSTNGDVGETFVRDYYDGDWLKVTGGANSYLIDGGGSPIFSDPSVTLGYPQLSKINCRFNTQILNPGLAPLPPPVQITDRSDHNGFVSCWVTDSVTPYDAGASPCFIPTRRRANLVDILTFTVISNPLGLPVYEPTTSGTINTVPAAYTLSPPINDRYYEFGEWYYFHLSSILRTFDRTLVEGTVLDSSGNHAQNVNVLMTNHESVSTDSQGFFSISYYSTSYPGNEDDRLIFGSPGLCRITMASPVRHLLFPVGPAPAYNESDHYNTGTYTVVFSSSTSNALKRGFDGAFGIVYYDRGNRSTSVNTNEKLELHIPFYTEKEAGTGLLYPRHIPVTSWSIKSVPPDWATHYQWVRTRNLQLSFYLEFTANGVVYVDDYLAVTPIDVGYPLGRYAMISLENLLTYELKYADSLLGYTWTVGDRIRFISKPGNQYYSTYIDVEIVGSVDNKIIIYSDTFTGEVPSGTFFEIYTPKREVSQNIYYEIGECYEVMTAAAGEKYHQGQIQNQDPFDPYNTPATGTFKTGDAWYRDRIIPYNNAGAAFGVFHHIDSASISDFYESEDDNIGRPNIYDPNLKQIRREKSVRFSDVYLEDTQINGLSSNGALNIETIEKGEGPVYKLIRVNDALLAIQGSQCNSLYINEIIYIDANANPSLTASTKVIGTIRPLSGEFGTINPESVVGYEGKAYFFDQLGGNVIRYAQDGLNPINYFKMRSYFGAKAREMASLAQDQTYAVGGFDPLNKRYLLTFKKNRINSIFTEETKVFNELTNRWTSSQSFISECYGMTGMSIISFKEGELWVHDSPVKNSFYGVQYTSKVGAVFNQESGKVRNFLALSEESDGVWSAPVIEVPPNANALSGMLSRLILTKFVKKEGVWYAAIMKDMNSPNFATPVEALINGRSMRGHVLLVTLENDQNTNVKLNAVNLKYIYSEPSKK